MTRLLLDTKLVLWWLNGDARLPQTVVEQVRAPEAEVFVSQASLWEMAIQVSIGRLQVDLAELERQVPRQGFHWLPIRNRHLLAVAELESDGRHGDCAWVRGGPAGILRRPCEGRHSDSRSANNPLTREHQEDMPSQEALQSGTRKMSHEQPLAHDSPRRGA